MPRGDDTIKEYNEAADREIINYHIENGTYYINIPIEVLADSRISHTAKLIFGFIIATDRKGYGSFYTNDKLTRLLSASQPTISAAFTELEILGLISIKTDGRRRFAQSNFSIGINKTANIEIPNLIQVNFIDNDNAYVSGDFYRYTKSLCKDQALFIINALIKFYSSSSDKTIENFNHQLNIKYHKWMEEENEIASTKSREIKLKGKPITPGYIYIIKSGQYVKIGKTNNPNQRIKQISTLLAEKHQILKTFHVTHPIKAEQVLHKKFKKMRKNGEWFDLTRAQINEVKAAIAEYLIADKGE